MGRWSTNGNILAEEITHDASKGLKLEEIANGGRWLKGPDFLWEDKSCWPAKVSHAVIEDDDPALRKANLVYTTSASESPLESLIKRYSSWWKLKRVVAWLLRYRRNLMKRVEEKIVENVNGNLRGEERVPNLTVEELQKCRAKHCMICAVDIIP